MSASNERPQGDDQQSERISGATHAFRQAKGLLIKAAILQRRQRLSNLFVVGFPLVCLSVLFLVQNRVAQFQDFRVDSKTTGEVPLLLNMPSVIHRTSPGNPIAAPDCNKRFVVKAPTDSVEDAARVRRFIGRSFKEFCPPINQFVPTVEVTKKNINDFVFSRLKEIDEMSRNSIKEGFKRIDPMKRKMVGIENLPDAGFTVHSLDEKRVSATLHVNDLLYLSYHKDNGFSLLSFRIPDFGVKEIKEKMKAGGSAFINETLKAIGNASASNESGSQLWSLIKNNVIRGFNNSDPDIDSQRSRKQSDDSPLISVSSKDTCADRSGTVDDRLALQKLLGDSQSERQGDICCFLHGNAVSEESADGDSCLHDRNSDGDFGGFGTAESVYNSTRSGKRRRDSVLGAHSRA